MNDSYESLGGELMVSKVTEVSDLGIRLFT